MQELERQLRGMKKVEPTSDFCKSAKIRLMSRIENSANESWLLSVLKKVGIVSPRPAFVAQARMRLLARITQQHVSTWMLFFKRLAASTLVMMLAVTSTLLYVDGGQYVSASEETVLKVLEGDVTVKHADYLIWNEVTVQTNLAAGDLIKVGEDSEAVLHFFDDSQVRLAPGTLVLLDSVNVSKGYARQAAIDMILHEGTAWVQTMNVDDGFARFKLVTRDSIIEAKHASFNVVVENNLPTTLSVYKHSVDVLPLMQYTNEVVAYGKVNSGEKVAITAAKPGTQNLDFSRIARASELTKVDYDSDWTRANVAYDEDHIAYVRMQEFENLQRSVGVLPGQFLYPVKQIKERLSLALSFSGDSELKALTTIANKRIHEAIVLMEQGKTPEAKEALMAYQAATREIAEASGNDVLASVTNDIVANNQKTLVAALPSGPSAGLINEALFMTEELFVSEPLEREQVRLENTNERLAVLQELVDAGNLESAKEVIVSHELAFSSILQEANAIEDEDERRALLESVLISRNEQLRLINNIADDLVDLEADAELLAMVDTASTSAESDVQATIALIKPLKPTEATQAIVYTPVEIKANEFVEKVNIYSSYTGQKNQIDRLMKVSRYKDNLEFINLVRSQLNPRSADYMYRYIIEAEKAALEYKGKQVQRKIERVQNLNQ